MNSKIIQKNGVFFKKDHPFNYSGICVGIHNSFNGELSAILYALKNTPYNKNLNIITDSLSAKLLIENIQFHLENNLNYKTKFNFRWITNKIIENLKIRYKMNSKITFSHIYSHIDEKQNLVKYKDKIMNQMDQYKNNFELMKDGNENADKLAKIGSSNDINFNIPFCDDNYFLINCDNQIINQKIQNYLTKAETNKLSLQYKNRIYEKWNLPSNLIHPSSFNFNNKINWKDNEAIDFLIKLRAKDLKLKDKIFEQLNNAKNSMKNNINFNDNDNESRTSLWIKYWSNTYKDNLCELCKDNNNGQVEDINHFLINCPIINSQSNLMNLQSEIKDIIISGNKKLNDSLIIPSIFSNNILHKNFIKYNNNNWKSIYGLLGFIPNDFIEFLKSIKVNINQTIMKIHIALGFYWKKLYKERCNITCNKLNCNKNFKNIFSTKKLKRKINNLTSNNLTSNNITSNNNTNN